MPLWYHLLLFALGNLTLHLLDVVLTRFITIYLRKYQGRVRRWIN